MAVFTLDYYQIKKLLNSDISHLKLEPLKNFCLLETLTHVFLINGEISVKAVKTRTGIGHVLLRAWTG